MVNKVNVIETGERIGTDQSPLQTAILREQQNSGTFRTVG
jgi:hypothetical protein